MLFTRLRASNPRRVAGDTALSQASSFHFVFPTGVEKPSSTLDTIAKPGRRSRPLSFHCVPPHRFESDHPRYAGAFAAGAYKFSGALAPSSVFQTVVIRGGVTQRSPRFHRDDLATAGVVGLFEARRLRPPPSPAPLSAAFLNGSAFGASFL